MGQGTFWMSGMGREMLQKVQDRSGGPLKGQGPVGDPPEVLEGSRYTLEDPGRVLGRSRRSGTGWGTFSEVQDGLDAPPEGSERV